nr:uncharacterized protein LOC111415123 [Onthophagus taurus]
MSTFNWPRELTLKLINVYREQPVLYNPNHPNYKNTAKRFAAIMEIRRQLKSVFPDYKTDANEIRKKIHGIRTQYIKEKKMRMLSKKYRRTLWCYERLQFLDNIDKRGKEGNYLEATLTDIKEECPFEFNDEDKPQIEASETLSNLSKSEEASSTLSEETCNKPAIQDATSSKLTHSEILQSETDDVDCFIRLLTNEFKKIRSTSKKRKLKKQLFNLVLDAQEEEENLS